MNYRPYSGPNWPTAKRKSINRKRGRRTRVSRETSIDLTLFDQAPKEKP